MKKIIVFLLLVAATLPLSAVAGGWSVVTLEEWPQSPRAGQPVEIRFIVRAHGQTPAGGLSMKVIAHHAASDATVHVSASEESRGKYHASLILDEPGAWTWRIEGYGSHPMPDLMVSGPEATAEGATAERLYIAKGCVTCHANRAVEHHGIQVSIGPDLTQYVAAPDFLQQWLNDPRSIRPNSSMPDLELDGDEISALVEYFSKHRARG